MWVGLAAMCRVCKATACRCGRGRDDVVLRMLLLVVILPRGGASCVDSWTVVLVEGLGLGLEVLCVSGMVEGCC